MDDLDDLNILFKAGKILRKQSHPRWLFNFWCGYLLVQICPHKWDSYPKNWELCVDIDSLIDLLMQSFKPSRQCSYSRRSFHNSVETPVAVGIGLSLHHSTRSKGLVEHLSELNLSISYEKVLKLKTAIANSIERKADENGGVYIPAGIDPSTPVYFTIDNTDLHSFCMKWTHYFCHLDILKYIS